jgi:hypothetical protein
MLFLKEFLLFKPLVAMRLVLVDGLLLNEYKTLHKRFFGYKVYCRALINVDVFGNGSINSNGLFSFSFSNHKVVMASPITIS